MKSVTVSRRDGFTIVELLIVVVIMAILAAISVVAYTGFQNRAHDAIVQADLSNFRKQMDIIKADLGHYPRASSEFTADTRITRSSYDEKQNNVYYVTNFADDTYAFGVRSRSGKTYMLTNTSLQEDVTVHGLATAQAVGFTSWGEATGNVGRTMQCYSITSGVGTWFSSCPLVQ